MNHVISYFANEVYNEQKNLDILNFEHNNLDRLNFLILTLSCLNSLHSRFVPKSPFHLIRHFAVAVLIHANTSDKPFGSDSESETESAKNVEATIVVNLSFSERTIEHETKYPMRVSCC